MEAETNFFSLELAIKWLTFSHINANHFSCLLMSLDSKNSSSVVSVVLELYKMSTDLKSSCYLYKKSFYIYTTVMEKCS